MITPDQTEIMLYLQEYHRAAVSFPVHYIKVICYWCIPLVEMLTITTCLEWCLQGSLLYSYYFSFVTTKYLGRDYGIICFCSHFYLVILAFISKSCLQIL